MVSRGGESDGRPVVQLVDDDPDLLDLADMVLDGEGLRVITASNGRRALAALEVLEPDVIVTDLMMPELDGLGFIQAWSSRTPRWSSRGSSTRSRRSTGSRSPASRR